MIYMRNITIRIAKSEIYLGTAGQICVEPAQQKGGQMKVKSVRPGKRFELAALIHIHDLWRARLVDLFLSASTQSCASSVFDNAGCEPASVPQIEQKNPAENGRFGG